MTSKPVVAMLVFPELTLIDLVGPQTALSFDCDVHLVGETIDEVVSDTGMTTRAEVDFAHAPKDVDVLFVPGGRGTPGAMNDATLAYLRDRAERATWITSVCTGSLVLGAAGLLDGYRASSHWASHHLLPEFGAIPVKERVVVDRNRITAGGSTAGIDFGLSLLATMFNEEVAQTAQLMMEYDPAPPFNAGTPATAPAHLVEMISGFGEPVNDVITARARKLRRPVS